MRFQEEIHIILKIFPAQFPDNARKIDIQRAVIPAFPACQAEVKVLDLTAA